MVQRSTSSKSSSSKEEGESRVTSPLGEMLVKGKKASGGPSTSPPRSWPMGRYMALIIMLPELLIMGDISSNEASLTLSLSMAPGGSRGASLKLYRRDILALNIRRRLLLGSITAQGLRGSCWKLPSLGPLRSPARGVRGVVGFERWITSSSLESDESGSFITERATTVATGTSSSSVVSPQSAGLVSTVARSKIFTGHPLS